MEKYFSKPEQIIPWTNWVIAGEYLKTKLANFILSRYENKEKLAGSIREMLKKKKGGLDSLQRYLGDKIKLVMRDIFFEEVDNDLIEQRIVVNFSELKQKERIPTSCFIDRIILGKEASDFTDQHLLEFGLTLEEVEILIIASLIQKGDELGSREAEMWSKIKELSNKTHKTPQEDYILEALNRHYPQYDKDCSRVSFLKSKLWEIFDNQEALQKRIMEILGEIEANLQTPTQFQDRRSSQTPDPSPETGVDKIVVAGIKKREAEAPVYKK